MTIVWIMVMIMILTMPIWKSFQAHRKRITEERIQNERVDYTREFLKSEGLYDHILDEHEISDAAFKMSLLRYDLALGTCRVLIENELKQIAQEPAK